MLLDDRLAQTIRATLTDVGAVKEVKMFGGIGFMLNGNLLAGASTRGLLLRVGKERSSSFVQTLPSKKKKKAAKRDAKK